MPLTKVRPAYQARAARTSLKIIALLVVCLLWGCATWRPYQLMLDGPGTALPPLLRVTRPDSSRVVLTDPFVRGDTLYGLRRVRGDTLAFPLEQMNYLERERIHLGRSLAVGVGIPAVALGVAYFVVCVENDCSPDF